MYQTLLPLMTPVLFNGHRGHIRGRTLEGNPRYDIMLDTDNEIITNLPERAFRVLQTRTR